MVLTKNPNGKCDKTFCKQVLPSCFNRLNFYKKTGVFATLVQIGKMTDMCTHGAQVYCVDASFFFGTPASSKRESYNRTIYRAKCKGAGLTETRAEGVYVLWNRQKHIEY